MGAESQVVVIAACLNDVCDQAAKLAPQAIPVGGDRIQTEFLVSDASAPI
jgi:hypothetical protein